MSNSCAGVVLRALNNGGLPGLWTKQISAFESEKQDVELDTVDTVILVALCSSS